MNSYPKTTPAIEVNGLEVTFDSQWVLKNFSLALVPGEKVTLTGPSGSGKSTVLKCLLGLVTPDAGSIKIHGQPLNSHNIWKIRQQLAYVAQEPDLGTGTVSDIIEKPFGYKANLHLRDNLNLLPEIMNKFNLPQSLLAKKISILSGGEKQRIALVTAILLDRSIVLLDEASAALDKENKQIVADYFRQTDNITVLSVSHDTEWLDFASRKIDIREHNNIFGEKNGPDP